MTLQPVLEGSQMTRKWVCAGSMHARGVLDWSLCELLRHHLAHVAVAYRACEMVDK
jgi:hypothetical protein